MLSPERSIPIEFVAALSDLAFWNELTRAHLSDVVMVLTATVLALMDLPLRRAVKRAFRGKSRLFRFAAFVSMCSFGFAAIAILVSWLLKWALLFRSGQLMAPMALVILLAVGVIAARQKEF